MYWDTRSAGVVAVATVAIDNDLDNMTAMSVEWNMWLRCDIRVKRTPATGNVNSSTVSVCDTYNSETLGLKEHRPLCLHLFGHEQKTKTISNGLNIICNTALNNTELMKHWPSQADLAGVQRWYSDEARHSINLQGRPSVRLQQLASTSQKPVAVIRPHYDKCSAWLHIHRCVESPIAINRTEIIENVMHSEQHHATEGYDFMYQPHGGSRPGLKLSSTLKLVFRLDCC